MPLPLIPLIIGGAALIAGAIGAKKGYDGVADMNEASKIGEEAKKKLEKYQAALEATRTETQSLAEEYGKQLLLMKQETVQSFLDFLQSIERKGEQEAMLRYLSDIGIQRTEIQAYKMGVKDAADILGGAVKAVGGGVATGAAVYTTVGLLGTASTGAAIGGLSGAAAKSATLAWLGGGSLAAGGLGMAGGAVVLGGVVAAPVIFVGGWVLAAKGEEALTQAKKYQGEVDVACEQIETIRSFLSRQLRPRINELSVLVEKLETLAKERLLVLWGKQKNNQFSLRKTSDVSLLQGAGQVIKALADISKTPILDENGEMNAASHRLYLQYKESRF